jgi:hypothetical protein
MDFRRLILALLAALLLSPALPAQRRQGPGRMTPLDRLERMTPEERRRVLDKLPPGRRMRIEEQLRRYENLPPEERARLRRRLGRFRSLPPEKQAAARRLFQDFRELPQDRRRAVRWAALELRRMDEPARRARLDSPGFRREFSAAEQGVIERLLHLAPRPAAPAGDDQ